MARKLASIVKISKVSPIENADRLEVVEMEGKGWRVVTQKNEFHVGDIGCYFEIDSFLDDSDARYAFLKDRCLKKFVSKCGNVIRQGIRIKTCKLRGVVSQGIVMPISDFPEIAYCCKGGEIKGDGTDTIALESDNGQFVLQPLLGADVTRLLKVEHYDEVKEQLQPTMGNPISGDAMGKFPTTWMPRSDEERVQNLGDWFKTMKGRRWEVTCKHDGTSCTIAYSPSIDRENPEIVCSRNLRLKHESANGTIPIYWQMAEKYNVLDALKDIYWVTNGTEFMIQGEIVGPGIQKDRNKENEIKFLCFRMWNITKQKFVTTDETVRICKKYNIPHVQIIDDDFPFFDKITTMEEALKFAEGKTEEGNEREGVVLKTCDDGEYASFKIVSNKYLLKQED